MSNVIGHATLNVVPTTKGFSRDLQSQLTPAGSAGGSALGGLVGGSFSKVVGPLMAAAGVVGMGAFVASTIKQAGGLEQSIGAINTVFAGSSAQMHTWASGAATSVGLARDQYNGLATLIGSQLKNAGVPMDELAGKTNDLVIAGADMASMFGGTTKDAVEAISSALKGERDPIEKYGVSLNEAKIKAEMATQAMNGMTFASEDQAKAAATLSLIMQQTADAQGNFARESQTYEGVMQRLGASWTNVTTTIGQAFLPIATAAGSVLLGMMPTIQGMADKFALLAPAIQGVVEILMFGNFDGGLFAAFGLAEDSPFIDFLFDVREAVVGLFDAFAAGDMSAVGDIFVGLIQGAASARDGLILAIAEALPGIIQAIVAMAPAILGAAVQSFLALVTAVTTAIPPLLTAVLGMVPQIITLLLSMVPILLEAGLQLFLGLVQALVVVIPQILTALVTMLPQVATSILTMLPTIIEAGLAMFMGLVTAVIELIPVLLTTVLDLLPVLITTILGMLPGILESGLTLFLGLVTAVITMLPQLITTVIGMLPRIVSTLVGMIPTLMSTGVTLFLTLVTAILKALPEIIGAIVTQVIPALIGAVIGAIPQLIGAGGDLIAGLVKGLWNAAGQVGAALMKIVGGAVEGFKDFLGIASPSKLFAQFGEWTGEGFAIGISHTAGDVEDSVQNLALTASRAMSGVGLDADVGVIGSTQRVADALANDGTTGATFQTIYNDHSTSSEDKQAKLQRAQTVLEATVAANVRR